MNIFSGKISHAVNLLPQETQKKLVTGYYLKFFSFLFFGLAVVVLVGAGLLAPSYFLANAEAESAERYLGAIEETVGLRELSGATKEIATLAERTAILGSFENIPLTAHMLSELGRALPADVVLDKIRIQHGDSGTGDVQITGSADSRAGLLRFADALKGNSFFQGVVVPVGQLVNEIDVPFSFSFRFVKNQP